MVDKAKSDAVSEGMSLCHLCNFREAELHFRAKFDLNCNWTYFRFRLQKKRCFAY